MHDDGRSKKIALLAHCLLNQQAKVGGLARFPAQVPHIAKILEDFGYSIVQMPCPEVYAAGTRRWGQVKEQYACYGYTMAYRRAAEFLFDGIMDYLREDYKVILLGIDGSPSCGVSITESNTQWGGSMGFWSEIDQPVAYIQDSGAFIDIIHQIAKERGVSRIPAFGLPLDMKDGQVDEEALRYFLKSQE